MARFFLRSKPEPQRRSDVFLTLTTLFCTRFYAGFRTHCTNRSYVPIFADAHNQKKPVRHDIWKCSWNITSSALIVVANWLFCGHPTARGLDKRNITAATIGWEMPGDAVSSVMGDNGGAGGRLALEHLHQLGHRQKCLHPWPQKC